VPPGGIKKRKYHCPGKIKTSDGKRKEKLYRSRNLLARSRRIYFINFWKSLQIERDLFRKGHCKPLRSSHL